MSRSPSPEPPPMPDFVGQSPLPSPRASNDADGKGSAQGSLQQVWPALSTPGPGGHQLVPNPAALSTIATVSPDHAHKKLPNEGAEDVKNQALVAADTDKNRSIDFREFAAMPFHKGKSRKDLRVTFNSLDTSRDGKLDWEEFEQYRFRQAAAHVKATKKAAEGGRGPLKVIFGIGPEDEATGMPSSSLIYPLSLFGLTWICLNVLFLAYIAVATPPMIAFYWLEDPCVRQPTLDFDFVLDIFFLVDILMNFNMGYIEMGQYVDGRWAVFKNYVKGYFAFDCATSFPVSFFELMALQDCAKAASSEGQVGSMVGMDNTRELRFVRAIKPLRLFKLARIVKLTKGGVLVATITDFFSISPKYSKTFAVTINFIMTLHMVTCAWWLFKVLFMDLEDIELFLEGLPWGAGREAPSLQTHRGKLEAYIVSMYVATMTLTTVGYGDISADNTPERIGYILLFISGAFIWGNLLATIDEIHSSATAREKKKLDKVQQTLDFLIENECPRHIRSRIIQWTRFSEDYGDDVGTKSAMISELPEDLQKALVRHLYTHNVSRVPIFAYIESVDDADAKNDRANEEFLNDIFVQLEYKAFPPGAVLVNFSDPADRLIIVVSGKVSVEFEHSTIQREVITLDEGDYIGDMALLSEADWAVSTCFHLPPAEVDDSDEPTEIMVTADAMHYVVVLQLTQRAFQATLERGAAVTRAAVEEYGVRWKQMREMIISEARGGTTDNMKLLMQWGDVAWRAMKRFRQHSAVEENNQWKAMRAKKMSLNRSQENSSPLAGVSEGEGVRLGRAGDWHGMNQLENAVRDIQGAQQETMRSIDRLHSANTTLMAICRSNSQLLRHLVASSGGKLPNEPEGASRVEELIAAAEAAIIGP